MKTNSFDSIPISYDVTGSGKPAVVFVHGWCCDSSFWESQMPYFEKDYTVVTLDLAGHGKSGAGRTDWTMRAFGRDVVAVVEELGIDHAVLVGHSMGGRVVLEAASMLGEKAVGVVGVDCFQRINAPKPEEEDVQRILDGLRNDLRTRIIEFVAMSATVKTPPELVERIIDTMSSGDPEIAALATKGLIDHDLIGVMGRLHIPIRCISAQYGSEDYEATFMAARDFDVEYMPGFSHFVMMEDPRTFNNTLDEYVEEFEG